MTTSELSRPVASLERVSLASTIDLLELLYRRKIVFIVSIVTAVLLGLLYYFQATPVYQSDAGVLLISRQPDAVTREQRYESSFEDYLATHRALIVSPMIVRRAIGAADLGKLKTFSETKPENLEKSIIDQLIVSSGPRELGENADSIMTLAFQGPISEECPVIVRAILDSYRAFLDETYRGMSNDTLRLIGEARDLLRNDLQLHEDAYIQFRQDSPLVSRGADEVNPLQDRLAAIETRRTDLLLRRAEIEGQLKSLAAANERGYDANQMTAFVASLRNELSATDATASPSTLDSQLVTLTDRERQLLEHFGPHHPHVVALHDRIEAVRQMQALPPSARTGQNDDGTAVEPTPSAIVDVYVTFLKQELDWINTSEELLSNLYQKEHGEAQELSSYQLRDERFRRTIDLTQELYEGVIGQLQEASLVKDFGGFDALVIADPDVGEKVGPRGKIIVALAVLIGGFVGVASAVVTEMRDKRFRSRDEIQSILGVRVFVEVPAADASMAPRHSDHDATTVSPQLWTHAQSGSPQSEAIRSLRTMLLFNPSMATRRVLQLACPSSDDGMSVIAANLAVSIAQLGHRVLMIDTNISEPQQDRLFGVPSNPGLASLLKSDNDLTNAVHDTGLKGLSVLPAGTPDGDVDELFTSVRFSEVMKTLREQFDYIVLDTAPLLLRSDACIIASQVDGVLLGFRPTKDSRERTQRAMEILTNMGIQPIGAVVNSCDNAKVEVRTK